MRFSTTLFSLLAATAATALPLKAVENIAAEDVSRRDAAADDTKLPLTTRDDYDDYDDAEREKYEDNLEKLRDGNCGEGCHNSIGSYESKHWKRSNSPLGRRDNDDEEREKYEDNLVKLRTGNCGEGCHNSIASYESKHSRRSNSPQGRRDDDAEEREKYEDNLEKLRNGNCGQGCLNSINSYQSKNSRKSNSPSNAILIPRDDDDAEREKYEDNLEKLRNGNCGEGCHNSINSYQSQASRKSKALEEEQREKKYHEDDK
ncbi:uncharacterized protein BCR38DRAFT_34800 [Pseudomassariella vexata]|uniref:Uncharacterized protein n=1 Tax=Pseudomassariella vexata TaxID=1141098 RepID=A0A1Y2DQE9_9PEZI|nr:uncharacterized protein BCR38DRAFT_34800 [Pseudomassariella vexata]ORY61437.1 hypothetical protein BCR38DRAFT_34800 [Pseudomassariella vexata]